MLWGLNRAERLPCFRNLSLKKYLFHDEYLEHGSIFTDRKMSVNCFSVLWIVWSKKLHFIGTKREMKLKYIQAYIPLHSHDMTSTSHRLSAIGMTSALLDIQLFWHWDSFSSNPIQVWFISISPVSRLSGKYYLSGGWSMEVGSNFPRKHHFKIICTSKSGGCL